MIRTTQTNVAGPMDRAEAQAITDRIRNAVESLGSLVEQAHDRRAWKAMGYATWEAYVSAEFGFTRQRSYHLLDQGRVSKAISEAAGDLSTTVDISEREARDLKPDLPDVTKEIRQRVEAGEEPAKAVAEVVTAKRAEKDAERKAKQAENDAHREQARAALPDNIKAAEQAKAERQAGKSDEAPSPEWLESFDAAKDRIAELEEAVRVLEIENASLNAKVKLFGEMEAEWTQGGFAAVLAGKEQVIAAQASGIARESADKASWKRSSDMWKRRAEEAGWSNTISIDIASGEVVNG